MINQLIPMISQLIPIKRQLTPIKSQLKKSLSIAALLGLSTLATSSAQAAICSYSIQNEWNTGFVANITITNNGSSAIQGWSVNWRYNTNSITGSWNANFSGNNPYTASNISWNGTIQPGQSINFGVQGNKNGGSAEKVTINGNVCGVTQPSSKSSSSSNPPSSSKVPSSSLVPSSSQVPSSSLVPSSKSSAVTSSSRPSDATASSRSSTPPSSTPSSSKQPPSSSSPTTSSSTSSRVVDPTNPFLGAVWYVDPIWSAKAMAETGGSKVANYNTAVWMDRIGAIAPTDGSWGLRDHLNAALDQKANLILVVVYDLPNRDCNALASNGELTIENNGLARYKNDYIAPIAAIFSDPKYRSLRIIAIIEPDSLPNLVTNTSVPKCAASTGAGGYVEGTQHTLNTFYSIPNVYSYIDIGHSGWLGWDDNLSKSTTFIANAIKGTTHGVNSIRGFISNTANTTPLKEPFLDAYNQSGLPGNNGTQVRQAKFYEWNPHFSESTYVQAWRAKMIALGFPSTIGMLVDTSRNGWGGSARPTALSTSTSLETFVNDSRIDRRYHRGNWCNQLSGIGERPTVAPAPGIDAYVWVKPPGESDGAASLELSHDPQDPAKGFDRFCDPTFTTAAGTPTGAMAGAPVAGRWFSAGFQALLKNAYPPLQ